ncbi:MAG: peptide ABC transporter substrate-binding protein [Pyrinomonadaceae bacterium]
MRSNTLIQIRIVCVAILVASIVAGCSGSASSRFFGRTIPPNDNVLRYISGAEPESLDPHVSSGQPESRVYAALYEGLVEYHPKTLDPIPAIAERWEISPQVDEFIFYLRKNAKWSDGTPITARDFVYSFRRGFAPETLSRTASLGYAIKNAEAFNGHKVFVKKEGSFLQKDLTPWAGPSGYRPFGPETNFHKVIQTTDLLTLDEDEKSRAKALDADPKLKAAVTGAEFVPVRAEDIGVEAIDDHTLRLSLRQSAPYFLGLLTHQFFRLVPKQAIEKHGKLWTRTGNIVSNGPFRVKMHRPYDILIVERDPNHWDAANVHLDGIEFLPVEEKSTQMNLYKAGAADALLNHVVPAAWIDEVRRYKEEYMDFPENSCSYYSFNLTMPPFNNLKVRQAFSLALDRGALSQFRKVTKPLYDLTPTGIFPEYDKARARVSEEERVKQGKTPEQWKARSNNFDPARARQLLAEAGFPVEQNGNRFSVPSFPTDKVALTFNTNESNRQIAEFIQAQWKQNLGVTVPLKNMEFKTFLPLRNALQYDGLAQSLWSGDYMDPYTFLSLHYGKQNDGGSGFADPKYDKMLDDANNELDPQKRFEMLARAEAYVMEQLPVVPLTINATNWMKKPFVKGLYPNPGTLHPWKFVYIERDQAKWDADVSNIMDAVDPRVEAQLAALTATQNQTATTPARAAGAE